MKNKSFVLALLITMSLAFFLAVRGVPMARAFSGAGSGTSADPYVITTVAQLQEMKDALTKYYVLGNDIDATATHTWNENANGGYQGFRMVGTSATQFTGTLDGKGYKISNLYENRPENNNVGLFGYTGTAGVVKNVRLENENVRGLGWVGGLAGVNYGTVDNCYSTGAVRGSYYVGGLVGLSTGTVKNCYSTGPTLGSYNVGSLVGVNSGGTVKNCYSTGTVTCGTIGYSGGLIGQSTGTVTQCYSTSSVSGSSTYVGGLVGYMNGGTVTKCYSTGAVAGSGANVGGLIGYKVSGTVTNSFWDNQTSGRTTSKGGTGKTTENMKYVRTYTDNTWSENLTSPWDFVGNPYKDENNLDNWNIGTINNGYPFLSFFYPRPTKPVLISPENNTFTTDNTPTFIWTRGLYADNHRLLVDNDSDFLTPNENRIVLDNTYTIADENSLTRGTYYWKVVAINEVGENDSENTWQFTIITTYITNVYVGGEDDLALLLIFMLLGGTCAGILIFRRSPVESGQ